jgi:hypothetical protein
MVRSGFESLLWQYGDEPKETELPPVSERLAIVSSASDAYGQQMAGWLEPVVTWDPDPTVRAAAAAAAGRLGGDDSWNVIGLAMDDDSPEVRIAALRAHAATPERMPWAALEEIATEDPSADVRLEAVRLIAMADSESSRAALRLAVSDSDFRVRNAAKNALLAQGASQVTLQNMGQ